MRSVTLFCIVLLTCSPVPAKDSHDHNNRYCGYLEQLKADGLIDDANTPIIGLEEFARSANTKYPKEEQLDEAKLSDLMGYISYEFATCYSIDKSPAYTKRWLKLSSDYEYAPAKNGLARIALIYGGSDRLEKDGVEISKRGLAKGNTADNTLLAIAYITGRGVKRNPTIAIDYLESGAEAGETMDQHLLAYIHKYGIFGEASNTEKAEYWMNYTPKNMDITYECSIKRFVEYGVIKKERIAENLIKRCEQEEKPKTENVNSTPLFQEL